MSSDEPGFPFGRGEVLPAAECFRRAPPRPRLALPPWLTATLPRPTASRTSTDRGTVMKDVRELGVPPPAVVVGLDGRAVKGLRGVPGRVSRP